MIRLIQKADLDEFAKIYKELYDNADIGKIGLLRKNIIYLCIGIKNKKICFFVDIEDTIIEKNYNGEVKVDFIYKENKIGKK